MISAAALLLAAFQPPVSAPAPPAPPAAEAVRTVASVDLPPGGKAVGADLVHVPEDRLFFRTRDSAGRKIDGFELATASDFVRILADRRLQGLWPAAAEFGGPGLSRQRERALSRTELGLRLGAPQWSYGSLRQMALIDGWAVAIDQRFDALSDAGRFAEAVAEMRRGIARARADGKAASLDEFNLRDTLAGALAARGRVAEALELLVEGEAGRRADNGMALNYRVNRAALLAEAGRYAEALPLIESVMAMAAKIPDSYLDAWVPMAGIRACALVGLGRAKEAAADLRTLGAAGSEQAQTRVRFLACLNDEDALAREIVGQLNGAEFPVPAVSLLLAASVSRLPWAEPYRRVAARADVRAALAERTRPLPPELAAALALREGG
jgi:tetratricopeptide (TPR) repeat protein